EYELELGAIYSVKVIKVQSIGLYVQIHPSFSPILISFSMLDTSIAPHLSKESKIKPKNDLSSSHELENMFKEGQELIVKYMGRDPINGKHLLSRRAIFMHGSNTIAHQSHYFKSLRDAMAESED
ncbi:MAG: Polyribonucleotide nucleotidyltransferase 1, mitochondrial, partial [Paramarteilia canceri]